MPGLGHRWRAIRLMLAAGCLVAATSVAQGAPRPLVVELFTSQGCSSCPPADEIVARLARARPDILPLTFHVTYWNDLGWQDPFSLPAATDRQRRYVALSVSPEAYTPALVIDGRHDVVGSDEAAVQSGLIRARNEMVGDVDVGMVRSGKALGITIGAGIGHGSVLLVGYDGEHSTHIGRGENGGRTLLEANVVRSMTVAGEWSGQAMQLRMDQPAGEHAAVLLQAEDGRILGATR